MLSGFLNLLMGLLITVVLLMLGFLGYLVVDTVGVPSEKSTVTAIEVKGVNPPYTTTMLVGRVLIPQYHPTSYWIQFKIDNDVFQTPVKELFFKDVYVETKIEVIYGYTRLSKTRIPRNIKIAHN